jgi:hypothetical protein
MVPGKPRGPHGKPLTASLFFADLQKFSAELSWRIDSASGLCNRGTVIFLTSSFWKLGAPPWHLGVFNE